LGHYSFGNFEEINISKLQVVELNGVIGYRDDDYSTPDNEVTPFWSAWKIRIIKLPKITIINDWVLYGLRYFDPGSTIEIDLSKCVSLGSTNLNDNVFNSISGQTITLTIPSLLMTCNGGSPDGDINYLISNNNVSVILI
jgi:hypothetical protein